MTSTVGVLRVINRDMADDLGNDGPSQARVPLPAD